MSALSLDQTFAVIAALPSRCLSKTDALVSRAIAERIDGLTAIPLIAAIQEAFAGEGCPITDREARQIGHAIASHA